MEIYTLISLAIVCVIIYLIYLNKNNKEKFKILNSVSNVATHEFNEGTNIDFSEIFDDIQARYRGSGKIKIAYYTSNKAGGAWQDVTSIIDTAYKQWLVNRSYVLNINNGTMKGDPHKKNTKQLYITTQLI